MLRPTTRHYRTCASLLLCFTFWLAFLFLLRLLVFLSVFSMFSFSYHQADSDIALRTVAAKGQLSFLSIVRNPGYQMSSSSQIYQKHAQLAQKHMGKLAKFKVSASEFMFDLSFVFNFISGKLLHLYGQKEEVYNYYNNKNNVFNQYFVKKGWGWTTLAIFVFYAFHAVRTPHGRPKLLGLAFLRWLVATGWWILFTQWCFGLPIMDRVFLLSGGKCAGISPAKYEAYAGLDQALSSKFLLNGEDYESRAISSYSCRRLRGSWVGGHDPSGHVFLLVHASLYLFHEVKPFWPGWIKFFSSLRESARGPGSALQRLKALAQVMPHVSVVPLLVLWWFMLLVTNMYFHSLAEKLVGLLFGYMAVGLVYYLPRWIKKEKKARKTS